MSTGSVRGPGSVAPDYSIGSAMRNLNKKCLNQTNQMTQWMMNLIVKGNFQERYLVMENEKIVLQNIGTWAVFIEKQ